MRKKPRYVFIVVLLALTIVVAGCSPGADLRKENNAPNAAQIPVNGNLRTVGESTAGFTDEQYSIRLNVFDWNSSKYWVVDRNGKTIPEDKQFTVLYDILTGEPQCLVKTRYEETGRDEYGYVQTNEYSALFDLAGKLICDWDSYYYHSGFGDYLVRFSANIPPDDWTGYMGRYDLWNFKTGESFGRDVSTIRRLANGIVLLLDDTSRPLGTVDGSGNIISGFPLPEQYAYAWPWNGYVFASTHSYYTDNLLPERYFLLTPDFKQILSYDLLDTRSNDEVLKFADGVGTNKIRSGIVTTKGEEIYYVPDYKLVQYFDKDIVVTRTKEYTTYTDPERYRIERISDGAVLIEDVQRFSYDYSYEKIEIEKVLAYRDGYLYAIDKKTGDIKQKEMQGVSYIETFSTGMFLVSIMTEDYSFSEMLINGDLQEITSQGQYLNLRQSIRWKGETLENYNVIVAEKYDQKRNVYYRDLLDMEGNLILQGLNDVFGVGPDRIAVRKGFSVGLMDWDGNWIVKRSIFSELQND